MILSVQNLAVSYAKKRVLHGIDLEVDAREIVAVIGHNGAGKTTLLRAILGLRPVDEGRILYADTPITNRAPYLNVRSGIAYCPQDCQNFRRLTVLENLQVAAYTAGEKQRAKRRSGIERIFDLFPQLGQRRHLKAGVLSGGERQMLALGMALIRRPGVLLIDEPSGGLAPIYVDRVFAAIQKISRTQHIPALIVEQNMRHAFSIADTVYVMRNGRIVFRGTPEQALASMQEAYFGFENPAEADPTNDGEPGSEP